MTDTDEQILTQIQEKFFSSIDLNLVTELKKFDLYWLVDILAMLYRNNFNFPNNKIGFENFLESLRNFQNRPLTELQKELFYCEHQRS